MSLSEWRTADGALLSRKQQHARLADMIQGLAALMRDGAGDMDFLAAAQRLRDHLASHFAAEAIELSQANDPQYEEHAASHKSILVKIDETLAAFGATPGIVSRFAIVDAFETCLFDHELVYDG